MAEKEPSVEEIELLFRKVVRGEIPRSGDVLLRGTQGWKFAQIVTTIGGISFEDATGAAESGNDPIKMTLFDTELGGRGVDEDIVNDDLTIVLPGFYQLQGTVTYDGFTQDAELQIRVNGLEVGISAISALAGLQNSITVSGIKRLVLGDVIELFFGRESGAWAGDIFNLGLIAFSVALDSLEDI